MSIDPQIIEADWTWTGSSFQSGVQVAVSASGRIEAVGRMQGPVTHRLTGRALLPGMVNVHSHAFQRALRGYGETFPQASGSFWTWREAMYGLVEKLDADAFYQWSRQAYAEMLSCGITTVGEFHYFRHDASCGGFAFDDGLLQAAHDSGIRLVLLPSYYNTGGVGKPLAGGQKRFACRSAEEYWRQVDRLASRLRSDRQTLGASVHSIRAASVDNLVAIHGECRRRGMVFHMHVEEQCQEIADCVAAYGKTPMALLNERLEIDERFTAIHGTHTDPQEMRRFAQAGGIVCLCPLSEANLGDGIPDVPGIQAAGGPICIGTDSNARICMAEEMRWLEYVQRLAREKRGVCVDVAGNVAATLLQMATINGAGSLGVKTGRIEQGHWADLMAIDLTNPSLHGWTPENLLDALVLGTGENVVSAVYVGGKLTQRSGTPRTQS